MHQCALLDKDVYDEYILPLQKAQNHVELAKVQAVNDRIAFLPWTPEVGICELLCKDIHMHEAAIRDFFSDARISISHIRFLDMLPLRRRAKEARKIFSKRIGRRNFKNNYKNP